MKPAPPVTRSRTARKASRPSRRGMRGDRRASAEASGAPVSLAPQHGVRGSRGRTLELSRRDPPDTAAEPCLREDRLGEVGPRAVALGRNVPEPFGRSRVDESRTAAARWPTNVGQPRWSSTTATSSRSAPRRSIVRRKLWPVGAEEPRCPDDPRVRSRLRPRRGASRPAVGGGRSSGRPTRRRASASARRRRSRWRR